MANVSPSTVFLVSGGARGITAQCVILLAKQFHCKFILLGRTSLRDEPVWAQGVSEESDLKRRALADAQARGEKVSPAQLGKVVRGIVAQREIRGTLDAVQAAGGRAIYLDADITDSTMLHERLAAVNFGPISGILHGAGNLADKLIENKTSADFENVYAAKVAGLENLLSVVPAESLRHLILFSSVAGFYGNVGQADYAIANEILNKTAYRFKKLYPDCHVISINWGPWDGGMVTPQLRDYFDKLNIRVIPVEVGTHMLVRELLAPGGAPAQIVIGSAIRPQPGPLSSDFQTHSMRRTLRLADSPFLGDHVVNGKAVLPMVSAMSWMASAAEGIYRGYGYFGFDNYRVLKGVVFDDTLASEYTLDLKEVRKNADEIVVDALIRSQSDGKPRFHYSAQITLRAQIPDAPALDEPFTPSFDSMIDGAQFYQDGTLFHRYSFQGVDQILDLSEHGIVMRCILPQVDEAYQGQFPVQAFNYFMSDIGLQSVGIWSRHFYKMGSLPLRAGKGRHYRQGVFGQTFFVTMRVRSHSETNACANIMLHDEQGSLYAVIEELEVTLSRRLNELFLKNQLVETP
ncbi:MAG: KR domain-containing protein [Chloroflexi bacterium]|nr:KR domain-containing protein [Chloroflexota bacterium]